MLQRILVPVLVLLLSSGCPSKSGVPSGPATVSNNPGAPTGSVPALEESSGASESPVGAGNREAVPASATPKPFPSQDSPASNPPEPARPSGPCDPNVDCCRADDDCVPLDAPQPCSCPPCGKVWRWTLNQRGHAEYQDRWSRRRCRMPECETCPGGTGEYVGQAACVEGRCVVR